ncbi:right-handed parallel beta-helix repeat-containing protein [Chryseobacterium taklimakanense]|uniref:right-handed parallel beta-helix repeat-containing protein n=1 Tax=Chryseobacterium taklimakanense TaxID=536441 RepID=UPI001EF63260|nr:right-handed parallel beta-helix repeat-containing protein [Chryseobacterium taklimakanense]MCG7280438.1 right-handed parallel beta-helix repeat-containing protein [Chryseobacterium taklimakanense]
MKISVAKGNYKISQNISTTRTNTVVVFDKNAVLNFKNIISGFTVVHDGFVLKSAHIIGNGISAKDFYTGYGVLLNGVSFCRIENCIFQGVSGNNILLYPAGNRGCNNNVITNNKFLKPAFDLGANGDESVIMLGYSGYDYHHNNNLIDKNTIDCAGTLKIGIGIIGHGKNNKILQNTISNCRNYGVVAYESKDKDTSLVATHIEENIISNIGEISPKKTVKGMGIYLMKSINSFVTKNKIYNTLLNSDQTESLGAGAISISGSPGTKVNGNFIDGSFMYGIVSDYSFGSSFKNNTLQNIRKSGAYFINMNDVLISENTFKNIGEVVLKGYFENTSLPYIQEQMRSDKYKNIDTGRNFKITDNTFETDKDLLFFNGTPADPAKKYPGNIIQNNIFENNRIIGNSRSIQQTVNFRNAKRNFIR